MYFRYAVESLEVCDLLGMVIGHLNELVLFRATRFT